MHQESTTIFPSITPAATASIITGCYPAEHGIAGASWFDEARQEVAYYGDDFWVIARKGIGAFLRDFLVRLNGDRLTAPTLFELIEGAGRSTACVNYLVYRGSVRHRVNVPWLMALLPGVPLTETVDGPQMLCLGDFVTAPPLRHKRSPKSGFLHRFGMDDEATAQRLIALAGEHRLPDFTVAYFADNDYESHDVGPHAALPCVERVDRALGRMFDAAGGLARFLDEYCVVITSDHGHCEISPDAAQAAIDLESVLGEFRHAELGRAWREGDQLMICPNMRAAQVYVRHPSHEAIEHIARSCLIEPRVDLVMWKRTAPESGSYIVTGPRGRLEFWPSGSTRVATPANLPATSGRDAFGTAWSWRGDLEVLQMSKDGSTVESSEYPNAFERIAGVLDARNSGDVWVTARPGCEFQLEGGKPHIGGGSHGALHACDTLCPVIVAGARMRLPSAMRSVDIAPLCMEALGLPVRYAVGQGRIKLPVSTGRTV
jgi:hypothetical protein